MRRYPTQQERYLMESARHSQLATEAACSGNLQAMQRHQSAASLERWKARSCD